MSLNFVLGDLLKGNKNYHCEKESEIYNSMVVNCRVDYEIRYNY